MRLRPRSTLPPSLLLLGLLCKPGQAAPPVPPAPVTSATSIERLGLREAIELGLRGDPGVASALAQAERGRVGVLRAQLDRFSLKVDASLQEAYRASNLARQEISVLREDLTVETTRDVQGAPVGTFNAQANLGLPLFTGFRVTANVDRAKHQHEAALLGVQGERRRLAQDVLFAYWAVRRAELQQQVSQQTIERYDEMSKVVGARVRAGLVPPVDENRVEVRRQREVARRTSLGGTAAEGRAQLAVLLGLPPGAQVELTESAEVPPPPSADTSEVERLLIEAGRGRPDLLAARRQVLLGKDLVRIQMSNFYPQLFGTAWLQFGNNPFNPLTGARSVNDGANPFANLNGSAFVGATLSINLFDTLNTYTAVRDARAEVLRLSQEERRLGRRVEADVRAAHARLLGLYATREPLLKQRELARDTLGIMERRYKNGDALVLDYLEAQLDLLSAEIDLANSAASIAQTWGELQVATGRMPG